MSNRHPSHKPRVSDVTKWHWTYWTVTTLDGSWASHWEHTVEVSIGQADNFPDYYKVLISKSSWDFGFREESKIYKPKYFFGETAWMDVNRYVSDETGWIGFDLAYGGQAV